MSGIWKLAGRGVVIGCLLLTLSSTRIARAAVQWIKESSPTPLAFEDPDNWMPTDYAAYVAAGEPGFAIPPDPPGPELAPPGVDSTWFIGGQDDNINTTMIVEPTRNGYNGVITLTSDRDGSDAMHPKLGAGSIGGGFSNEVSEVIISANVTITGMERTDTGEINSTTRQMRVGQEDLTDDEVFPWGIVKQTHGTVLLEMANEPARGDLLITNDKAVSAGGIWEVGGDASLNITTDMQMGNKASVKAPGGIFRVRGSNVGAVTVGDRFQVQSQTAAWDVGEVDLGGGLRHQINRGKSVVEFVLDANGVTPIDVLDQLTIGSNQLVTTPNLGEQTAALPGFLRIKLSEPTSKGAGTYNPGDPGSGDVIVLFNSDRIDSTIGLTPSGEEEFTEGRFADPDHMDDAGTSPYRPLFEGTRVLSDYAGQQYSWQIHYFEGSGVTPAVILSDLQVTGTAGDLNLDTVLDENDRTALINAIAAPPMSHYDLLGAAQNMFDLNADDVIDMLDLEAFNTLFLPPTCTLEGDFSCNGAVENADLTLLLNNWAQPASPVPAGWTGNPQPTAPAIDNDELTALLNNWGKSVGSGSGANVPEPAALVLVLVGWLGLGSFRRRKF
jgi:hypothetical protein